MFLKGTNPVAGPSVEPISLAEATAYLRVDNDAENPLIELMISAAREAVELFTGKSLISQQFVLTIPSWYAGYWDQDRSAELLPTIVDTLTANNYFAWYPNASRANWNVIFLERSPLISIDSVKYYDVTGTLVPMDPSFYYTITSCQPGAFVLNPANSWPGIFERPDAIQITFTAGSGATRDKVPNILRQAVLMYTKHLYDNRDAFIIGSGSAIKLPFGIQHMLESQRVSGWTA